MPSPTTALQVITDALYLVRAIGVDQTLTNQETSDCLRKLNDLIESWSTQKLQVYGLSNQTFNTVAGQATYTIGTGGDWDTDWPPIISEPAYATVLQVTYPYVSITQEQYNLIFVKGQTGFGTDQVQYYLYVNEFPLGKITLWPVPAAIFPITFSISRTLSQVATAATVMNFPPGYINAFVYQLAPMLAPLFGRPVPEDVRRDGEKYFADVKRLNRRPVVMNYDVALTNNWNNWMWR